MVVDGHLEMTIYDFEIHMNEDANKGHFLTIILCL